MRAVDITPGDYEIKTYRGLERVTITEVKDHTRKVYYSSTSMHGRSVTSKFAFDANGQIYRLQSVIRPWAEAAEQHEDKAARARRLALAISALDKWLTKGGFLPAQWDHSKES